MYTFCTFYPKIPGFTSFCNVLKYATMHIYSTSFYLCQYLDNLENLNLASDVERQIKKVKDAPLSEENKSRLLTELRRLKNRIEDEEAYKKRISNGSFPDNLSDYL